MSDANPLEGDTPYEVLGVSESDTIETIETAKDELVYECRSRMVDAQRRDDADDYHEAADALRAVDEAYAALGLEGTAQSPSAGAGDTPHEVLGVGDVASLSEAAERRDELLAEYTAELSAELYDRDPWRFRQLVAAVERVDDAWMTLSSHKDSPEVNSG